MIRCTQCGARKNRANDPCIYCGANGEQTTSFFRSSQTPEIREIDEKPTHAAPRSRRTPVIVPIICTLLILAFVALCALAILGFSLGEDNKEVLVETWVTAINEDDVSEMSTVFPQLRLDGSSIAEEVAAEYLAEIRDGLEEEFGSDFQISAEIMETLSIRESRENQLIDAYSEFDVTIKRADILKIELTIEGSKKSETKTIRINIVKIDHDWYFDIMSAYFL